MKETPIRLNQLMLMLLIYYSLLQKSVPDTQEELVMVSLSQT